MFVDQVERYRKPMSYIKSLIDARLGEKDRNCAHFTQTGRNSIVHFCLLRMSMRYQNDWR